MWLAIVGLMIGIILGLLIPLGVPIAYSKYLSVALLAALDSVFGGVRANMENNYDNVIFITGFFSNTLLAGILAWIGERMGVELYTAAIFVFGVRIFQNLAIIRRHLLKR